MNKWSMIKCLMTLPIYFAVSLSYSGNHGGHGGDMVYAREFVKLGYKLVEHLNQEMYAERLSELGASPQDLREIIDPKHVDSAEQSEVYLLRNLPDGREIKILKDAINFPSENRILLSRTSWRKLSLEKRIDLVLHEYFGLLGIEHDQYTYSLQFKDLVSAVAVDIVTNAPESLEYVAFSSASLPLYETSRSCGMDATGAFMTRMNANINAELDSAVSLCEFETGLKCVAVTQELSTVFDTRGGRSCVFQAKVKAKRQ